MPCQPVAPTTPISQSPNLEVQFESPVSYVLQCTDHARIFHLRNMESENRRKEFNHLWHQRFLFFFLMLWSHHRH